MIMLPLFRPLAAFAIVLALGPSLRAEDLLASGALDPFRLASGWRGVTEAAAIPGETALKTGGEGRILVNSDTKDTKDTASTSAPARSAPLEGDAPRGDAGPQGDRGSVATGPVPVTPPADPARARVAELDAYWAEVSRAVREGDFTAYRATCHGEGVLVSGSKQTSQPLATALARWKKDFDDTREGRVKAEVEFRFAQRLGDANTAHETGIFRYVSQASGGQPQEEFIHLQALLVKKPDGWKILMEYQIGPATKAEWEALR